MYDSGQVHMEITAKVDNHLLKRNLRDAMWALERRLGTAMLFHDVEV